MSTTDDAERDFEELKALSLLPDSNAYGGELWGAWHDLADAQSPLAKEFFVERFQDSRPDWRGVSVSLLGFHYELDAELLDRIRNLLVRDPDAEVRIHAASVLGSRGGFPERALVEALDHDDDHFVRETAFSVLLELARLPATVQREERARLKSGEIIPSVNRVKQLLREQNMLLEVSQLDGITSQ